MNTPIPPAKAGSKGYPFITVLLLSTLVIVLLCLFGVATIAALELGGKLGDERRDYATLKARFDETDLREQANSRLVDAEARALAFAQGGPWITQIQGPYIAPNAQLYQDEVLLKTLKDGDEVIIYNTVCAHFERYEPLADRKGFMIWWSFHGGKYVATVDEGAIISLVGSYNGEIRRGCEFPPSKP